MKIKLSEIKIRARQRLDMGDIGELAESLKRIGQIHNIGVNQDNELIWGMRRYLAAKSLAWETIEATKRKGLTEEQEQEIELEEDIKRKDRSWQEKCLAVAKLFRIKLRNAKAEGGTWNVRLMASFTGMSKSAIAEYVHSMAEELSKEPRDEALWAADNYTQAIGILRDRRFAEAQAEMERRREVNKAYQFEAQHLSVTKDEATGAVTVTKSSSPVQQLDTTKPALPAKVGMTHVTLRDRVNFYNTAYAHLWKQKLTFHINPENPQDQFIQGWWFVGGGNVSDFYGSYQTEYLERIAKLFPDAVKVVHLFSGSLPPSTDYIRVGIDPTGKYKSDLEIDAHKLSSFLPFKADLIYADPPYSVEDSEHYQNSMVNRERVMQECALVLEPGGFLVWMDQALPLFNNNDLNLVGGIAYIRSTGNRFRVVSIFRKPLTLCPQNTASSETVKPTS